MRAAWKPGVAAASRIDTLQQTCCWPVTLVDLLGLQINTAFFPLFFVLLNNVKLISMSGWEQWFQMCWALFREFDDNEWVKIRNGCPTVCQIMSNIGYLFTSLVLSFQTECCTFMLSGP